MNNRLPAGPGRLVVIQPGIIIPAAIKVIRSSITIICPDDLRNGVDEAANEFLVLRQMLLIMPQLIFRVLVSGAVAVRFVRCSAFDCPDWRHLAFGRFVW